MAAFPGKVAFRNLICS